MVHPNKLKALKPTQWLPGQSGNPGGKPPLPPELKAIHALSRLEVCRIVSKYARMTEAEFQTAQTSPDTPKIHLIVLSLLDRAHADGDHAPIAWLLDRAIGKVQEHGPAEVDDEQERKRLESMTEAELLDLAKRRIAEIERTA